jgi:hypothetical protein
VSDATRSWKFVIPARPSTLSTIDRDYEFSRLAGLHEKKCLRALGICVEMKLPDGSVVEIGQAGPTAPLYGIEQDGVRHTQEALCILFGCDNVCPTSRLCPIGHAAAHKYDGLWQTANQRARASKGPIDFPTAIWCLEEAIWCRKWDLWCCQRAEAAVEPRLNAILASIPAGTSNKQKKKIENGMLYPVLGALKKGLTESAAAAVASAFATEFMNKAPSHPLLDALSDANAAARSERTTLLANGVVRPGMSWDELSDSTPAGKWHLFVAERQIHYGTNPIGKSTFEGHLAMIEALEACLTQLRC